MSKPIWKGNVTRVFASKRDDLLLRPRKGRGKSREQKLEFVQAERCEGWVKKKEDDVWSDCS